MNIDFIIGVNKHACENIRGLEVSIQDCVVNNDKDKANFGNLCIALKGFRMVAEATEALLMNEGVLKGQDGQFYKRVETNVAQEHKETPENKEQNESPASGE